jgi:hypothetical protein
MRIAIENAAEGMVLSGPVVDAKGRLILPKGETLNPSMISRLSRFGVTHLEVDAPEAAEGAAAEGGAEPKQAGLDEAALTAEIQARFASIGNDERMGKIRDAVVRQLVRSGVARPI